jgi:RNA polymerase sigma-70 factor (ECF subfamily)
VGCDSETELCRRYAGRIRGYGLRHLRDQAAAEDLVQHVLLILLQAVREGRAGDPARLDGYVLVTCRNCAMDMRRGDSRQRRVAVRSSEELPTAYEPDWNAADTRRIEHCLRELEARDRAIVLATFVHDHDADEIARTMQLSPGNVRVIRHRALGRLQACVAGGPSVTSVASVGGA